MMTWYEPDDPEWLSIDHITLHQLPRIHFPDRVEYTNDSLAIGSQWELQPNGAWQFVTRYYMAHSVPLDWIDGASSAPFINEPIHVVTRDFLQMMLDALIARSIVLMEGGHLFCDLCNVSGQRELDHHSDCLIARLEFMLGVGS